MLFFFLLFFLFLYFVKFIYCFQALTNYVTSTFFEELVLTVESEKFCLGRLPFFRKSILLAKNRLEVPQGRTVDVVFGPSTDTFGTARRVLL